MRIPAVSIVLVALGAPHALAQARPCPQPTDAPYLICQVDTAPRPDTANVVPLYPDLLMRASMSGSVRFTVVVDSTGRADVGTFTLVDSAHVMFVAAARTAVRVWRFQPAVKAGRAVAVRWEQVMSFATPPDSAPLGDTQAIQYDSIIDGTPRMHIGIGAPQPNAITTFAADALIDVQRQVLRLLAPAPSVDSTGAPRITLCVTVSRGSQEDAADSGTLAALSAPGRRAVIPRDCPRTYVGALWTQERAPAGYVDPYAMSVVRLGAWNPRTLVMHVEVLKSSVPQTYQCWAKRQTPTWLTQCKRAVTTVY